MVSLVRLASGIVWIEEAQPTAGSTIPGAGRTSAWDEAGQQHPPWLLLQAPALASLQ